MRYAKLLSRIPLLAGLLLFANSTIAQETLLQVQVLGHFYEAVLHENVALKQKVSNSNDLAASENVAHYAGTIRNIDDSWVRVSNINGQWQGVVSLFGTMHVIQQGISNVSGAASANDGLLYSKPIEQTGEMMGTCGSGDKAHSVLEPIPAPATENADADGNIPLAATFAQFCANQVNNICVLAEVEVAFDLAFQAEFGALATAQALSILNIVDGHYLNDLNMSIDAITVEMLANELFSTSVDPGVLLVDMRTKKNADQIPFLKNKNALTHLVTGRDFLDNILGVAYLNGVCDGATGFSTGTSSLAFVNGIPNIALTAVVVAHELGHNFGAEHDGPVVNAACPVNTFIMSPGLRQGITNFSSCSVTNIHDRFALLPTPALCLDYPADVAITADAGNNGALNANRQFTSAYTVTVDNGFQAVDQVAIDGSINLVEGNFVSVTANGNACTVAAGNATYNCVVANPGVSVALRTQVLVNNNISNVSITQIAVEQTADVQDVVAGNNSLTTQFAVSGGNVTPMPPPAPPAPTPPTVPPTTPTADPAPVADDESGGSSGNFGAGLILSLLLLYLCSRRRRIA